MPPGPAVALADALALALVANAAAWSTAVGHVQDRDLGGAASDPWTPSGLALGPLADLDADTGDLGSRLAS